MKIKDIIITQDSLRNKEQVQNMVKFLENNKNFADKIVLSRFPDGKIYIQDGHHRLCALYISKRKFLESNEYTIKDWTYEQYLEINLELGWMTPYNPLTEIRIPDISFFKRKVNSLYSIQEKIDFIMNNKDLYSRKRTIHRIEELVNNIF